MSRHMGWMAAAVLVPVMAFGEPGKWQMPTEEQQAAALKKVHDAYSDDYAKVKLNDKVQLGQTLLRQAGSVSNPAEAFVLLCEARDLAAQGGDLATASNACAQLVADFPISLSAAKQKMFEIMGSSLAGPVETQAYLLAVLQGVDEAAGIDEFAIADADLKLAELAAAKSQDPLLASSTHNRRQELTSQRQEYERIKPSLASLQNNPDDAAAKLAVGKYACFALGNWQRGLPLLAESSDAMLKGLAKKELGDPGSAEGQLAIADGWMAIDQGATPALIHIRLHAYQWYLKAAPGLTGLEAKHAEKRLTELEPLASKHWRRGELWVRIRDGLHKKELDPSERMGGAFGKKTFEEVPAQGALLIGFNYGMGRFASTDTVSFMQAIYLTPTGEIQGQPHGIKPATIATIKARHGYAVGAMTLGGGGNLDGFEITFMHIQNGGLNPKNTYSSGLIGTKSRRTIEVGGDGTPIVGIHGHENDTGKDGDIGLGVILLQAPSSGDATAHTRHSRGPETK